MRHATWSPRIILQDELVRDQRRTLRSKGKGSKKKPDSDEEEGDEEETDTSACELASEADLCCSGDFKTCPTSCHGNIATCECDVGGVDGGYFPTLKSNVGDSCLRRWDTSCTPENDTCCCPATVRITFWRAHERIVGCDQAISHSYSCYNVVQNEPRRCVPVLGSGSLMRVKKSLYYPFVVCIPHSCFSWLVYDCTAKPYLLSPNIRNK